MTGENRESKEIVSVSDAVVHLTAEEHPEIARRHEIAWQLTVSEIQTKGSALISPDTTLRTQPRRSK
jgi:hypothetical protein